MLKITEIIVLAHFTKYTAKLYSISNYDALRLQDDWTVKGVVTVVNCRQHIDYNAIGSSVTVLLAVNNGDYTITIQSPCSHSVL